MVFSFWNLFSVMLPWLTIYDQRNHARLGVIYFSDMMILEKSVPEDHTEFLDVNFVAKMTKKCFNEIPVNLATEWINKT